jgi:PilZ domain-containing protein
MRKIKVKAKPQAPKHATFVTRPPRYEANADIAVVDDIGRDLQGRLWNISEGGFMAECEEKVRLGSVVVVDLPGRGRVKATVQWALGWRFGAKIIAEEAVAD